VRPSAPGRTDSFFVCATPRTGSSLLLGLLESTGVAGRPEAFFREPDELMWAERWQIPLTDSGRFDYADYVRAALAAGTTDNGVFGSKLMWGTLDEVVAKLGNVYPDLTGADLKLLNRVFGRLRFVYVRRDDAVAQAVSWVRAEQTSTWYVGDSGDNGRPPGFDPDRIDALTQTIVDHNAAWERWFAAFDVQPYRVRYEELEADMIGVTLGILDFLGLDLPDGRVILPRHRRQADALNDEWIGRYRRLARG
jgi:LPS sulfotransferase NodH